MKLSLRLTLSCLLIFTLLLGKVSSGFAEERQTVPAGNEQKAADPAEEKSVTTPVSPRQAARLMQEELQPGSLIVHRGECLAVKIYTCSSYTHVGVLLPTEQGDWIVYDSANGEGVRKTLLTEYLQGCMPDDVAFYHPIRPLSASQTQGLKTVLEEHLGRPYSISHFTTGNPAEGLHCSEYVTLSLMKIQVLQAKRPARVSPASLLQGIEQAELYQPGSRLQVEEEMIPAPPVGNWYQRLWSETQACSSSCYKQFSRSVLCCD